MKKQADRKAIAVSAALTLLILLGIGGVLLRSKLTGDRSRRPMRPGRAQSSPCCCRRCCSRRTAGGFPEHLSQRVVPQQIWHCWEEGG